MPQNKRESIVFTVMMCFTMVLVMSNYNTALILGGLSVKSIQKAWLGLPIGFIVAMICDVLIVSQAAKGFAFRYLIKPKDSFKKIGLCISCSMVVPMVFIMSFYGATEYALFTGEW